MTTPVVSSMRRDRSCDADGIAAVPAGDLQRKSDFHAELLCLNESSSGEGLTRDAGWKPEVVLDSRARARLPPSAR